MDLLTIVTTANALVNGLAKLGFSLSDVTALQQKAESEGRELELDDFKQLRDGARAKLDALSAAIDAAEEVASPVAGHRPPSAHPTEDDSSTDGT